MLLAVWNLQEDAYAVAIQQRLLELTGETWSFGSIYVSLERMTDRELVSSELGEPSAERGGRAKRIYSLTTAGRASLVAIRELQNHVWASVSVSRLKSGLA